MGGKDPKGSSHGIWHRSTSSLSIAHPPHPLHLHPAHQGIKILIKTKGLHGIMMVDFRLVLQGAALCHNLVQEQPLRHPKIRKIHLPATQELQVLLHGHQLLSSQRFTPMNRNVHITFCSLPSLGNRTEQSCQKNFLVLVKVVCQDLPQSQPLLGLFHGSHFIPFPPRCKGERSGQRIFSFGFWKKKDLHWHLATIWLVSKKDLTIYVQRTVQQALKDWLNTLSRHFPRYCFTL